MDIREAIKKAKKEAANHDEVMLAEGFEQYLDLIEIFHTANQAEQLEITPRLRGMFASLKEIAGRVALGYGMDPNHIVTDSLNPDHIDPNIQGSVSENKHPETHITKSFRANNRKRNQLMV